MDDVERAIRSANRSATRRNDPLTARAERELAGLLATPAHRPVVRRRPRLPPLMIAAVLSAVLVVTGLVLLRPTPALAHPPVLETRPVALTRDEALDRLARIAAQDDASLDSTVIRAETWFSAIDVAADEATSDVTVQPQEITRTRLTEGALRIVTVAGPLRWGVFDGSPVPSPGTVIESLDISASEQPFLFTQSPPRSAAGYAEYLEPAGSLDSGGGQMEAIALVANEWRIAGPRAVAVLRYLRSLDGVTFQGEVTDRLGRNGYQFCALSRSFGTMRHCLIFDVRRGGLVSAEVVYLGGNPLLRRAPAGFTYSYQAWRFHE